MFEQSAAQRRLCASFCNGRKNTLRAVGMPRISFDNKRSSVFCGKIKLQVFDQKMNSHFSKIDVCLLPRCLTLKERMTSFEPRTVSSTLGSQFSEPAVSYFPFLFGDNNSCSFNLVLSVHDQRLTDHASPPAPVCFALSRYLF